MHTHINVHACAHTPTHRYQTHSHEEQSDPTSTHTHMPSKNGAHCEVRQCGDDTHCHAETNKYMCACASTPTHRYQMDSQPEQSYPTSTHTPHAHIVAKYDSAVTPTLPKYIHTLPHPHICTPASKLTAKYDSAVMIQNSHV